MSIIVPPPSPEAQLKFLAKLQRLFAEGDFTATYKFALLIALADLAVELGADDGAELSLTNQQIAKKFIQVYWHHVTPYGTGRADMHPGVLIQNIGSQAAVVTAIAAFRSANAATGPLMAETLPGYTALVSKVAATVSAQPLTYLQNFGGTTDPFIYERAARGSIRLKAGVSYCLRRFYPLVQHLSRSYWVEHIKKNRRNHAILGDAGDLEDFLFSTSRQSLSIIGEGLRKLDGNVCFYCGHSLNEVDVDHFVPFSLYPRDLAHNFVIAHPACNRSKSSTLAARIHLERWLQRLLTRSDDLMEIGERAGVAGNKTIIQRVALWSYSNTYAAGGQAWVSSAKYEPVGPEYLALF